MDPKEPEDDDPVEKEVSIVAFFIKWWNIFKHIVIVQDF